MFLHHTLHPVGAVLWGYLAAPLYAKGAGDKGSLWVDVGHRVDWSCSLQGVFLGVFLGYPGSFPSQADPQQRSFIVERECFKI